MHSSAKLKCLKPSRFVSQQSENMLKGIGLKCYKSVRKLQAELSLVISDIQ